MKKTIVFINIVRRGGLLLLLALSVSACATTLDARHVKETGFLEDYSKLKQVKSGEALEVYWNPDADLSAYNKLLIDPIELWCCAADSKLKDIPAPELQRLTKTFTEALRTKLGRDYELVDEPGPGVLRLHAALTEARKSVIPLDVLSTIYPSARVLSEVKRLATGTEAFVGSASFEAKLTDSNTGGVLFEEADRRAGGKSIEKWSTDSWHDVDLIFDHWAEGLQNGFREKRMQAQAASEKRAAGS